MIRAATGGEKSKKKKLLTVDQSIIGLRAVFRDYGTTCGGGSASISLSYWCRIAACCVRLDSSRLRGHSGCHACMNQM